MVITVVRKNRIGRVFLVLWIALIGAALLIWPQAVAGGIDRGVSLCYRVILPSLFPFLVLAGMISRTGLDRSIGRRLEGFTRFVFGLPGCCAMAIFLGFAGGYPAGAAAVRELLESGAVTRRQAKRLLRFCVNAGPAFVISTVGAGMAGSIAVGWLLLAAHTGASLMIGIVCRIVDGKEEEINEPAVPTNALPAGAALTQSVNGACRTLLSMCGFVILFAGAQSLMEVAFSIDSPALAILLEVTGGCAAAAKAPEVRPLLWGMALGWGGLSVHCQLLAILSPYRVIDRGFFGYRLIHGALGGLLSLLLFWLVPVDIAAAATSAVAVPATAASAPAAITLVIMCLLLLFTNSKKDSNKSLFRG
ncbi:MAG: hypothetical protein ACOYJY_05405 [Acutalibacteraceae bacterium]|jgi:sporulation integral membrane protein YlbJ